MLSTEESSVPLSASVKDNSRQCARHQKTTIHGTDRSRYPSIQQLLYINKGTTTPKPYQFVLPVYNTHMTDSFLEALKQTFSSS